MAELLLLGLGVEPRDHATVEVLQAAGDCAAVFSRGLDEASRRFLARFCRGGRVTALAAGASETHILKELARGKTVALATLGHPFYWDALAARLARACEKRGIRWRTFGAVSPMGLALSHAGVTLGTGVFGLQSFDYASIARESVTPNPEWPLAVYFYSPLNRAAFSEMAERLARLYPAGREATWYDSSGSQGTTTLRGLGAEWEKAGPSLVLYLEPASRPRSRVGRLDLPGAARPGRNSEHQARH